MANVIQKNSISAELVQKMVDAALAKANAIGVPVNVAILDDGGNLKAFSRISLQGVIPPVRNRIHQLRSDGGWIGVQRKEDSRSASCDKRGSDTD